MQYCECCFELWLIWRILDTIRLHYRSATQFKYHGKRSISHVQFLTPILRLPRSQTPDQTVCTDFISYGQSATNCHSFCFTWDSIAPPIPSENWARNRSKSFMILNYSWKQINIFLIFTFFQFILFHVRTKNESESCVYCKIQSDFGRPFCPVECRRIHLAFYIRLRSTNRSFHRRVFRK